MLSDITTAQQAPPFRELVGLTYDPDKQMLTLNTSFAAPCSEITIKLSEGYVASYPRGEAYLMVGSNFHVASIGATCSIKDLCLRARSLAQATLNEARSQSPQMGDGDGMGSQTTSWTLEPTVDLTTPDVHGGTPLFGANADLLSDVNRSMKLRPMLTRDDPLRGVVSIVLDVEIPRKLTPVVCDAWNVRFGCPLKVKLEVDRSLYTAAPMTVDVRQDWHAPGLPPFGLCGQLKSILEVFCSSFKKKAAGETRPALEVLLELGFEEKDAVAALKKTSDVHAAAWYLMHTADSDDCELSKGKSSSSFSIEAVKELPSSAKGFLEAAAHYVVQRMPTANEYCVICDRPHLFGSGQMLGLSVCNRGLCTFRFEELNVAREIASSVAMQTGVVDLLLSIARAACQSSRFQMIFQPFPDTLGTTAITQQSIELVRTAFQAIPSMTDLVSVMSARETLDARNSLSYPLFRWVVSSNKSHIVKLPSNANFSFMKTDHQFILATAPPAKMARFEEVQRATKARTVWAFHGSNAENWHSILRNGLKNASGTKLQVHGAAYGKGIYLSPNAGVSFGYSGIGGQTSTASSDAFIDFSSMHCIAVCEVLDTPNLKKQGTIWVHPDEDAVLTRFLFVYTRGNASGNNVDLTGSDTMELLCRLRDQYAR